MSPADTPASASGAPGLRLDTVVTHGVFALDGGRWEVDNNVYVIGDQHEVVVIDAAHEAAPIVEAVAGRSVTAILLTHAHNDHVTAAPELADALGAPVLLHPADDVLWEQTHPGVPHEPLVDGLTIDVGGVGLHVLHTPGHSPGSCCFHVPAADLLFSGDTLFAGGPGATGRSYSDFDTIIESIRTRLLTLPGTTRVFTGHGDPTTIGAEAPHLQEWIDRGY